MDDGREWVMSCGAKDHEGSQRHSGALINWRRRLKSYRKVHKHWLPRDCRPALLKRANEIYSEMNRRVLPLEWRIEISREQFMGMRYPKGRPMVLGRGDRTWDGGPIGVKYRSR